ncbi:hypothetical protein PtA15_14A35 [Puccinia triticina]|uniref:Uncharacterized protein n=1 Tax=Puccinia triticina TaxID=208348 RepID=A0ABY7D2Q7_9BASI|nr:uncharacterized protein PtA15_14A35 [Puccinia triticina]WAQ91155.1 hypothetical protein PtA15_14A35 [Puccinia triticina]
MIQDLLEEEERVQTLIDELDSDSDEEDSELEGIINNPAFAGWNSIKSSSKC